ncbi:hypothetical protein [uncultured Winogradskyella sp.]|uniref:hypothetical protein n=1 Tax=uncultured Winogradskyella sp. TaxID=395353 RepID=UPI00260F83CF|nr:hypothetical protein [uncultured Winogradskyella sp.]
MKKILVLFACLGIGFTAISQEHYTINGDTLALKTEVDGKLDLLWNTFDGNYRYFVKSNDNSITELKNTKDTNNKYLEEYKSVLSNLTGQNTDDLKLTLYSLKSFINRYNASVDPNYTYESTEQSLGFRLGFWGGVTNNPFVSNPENKKLPMLGLELEVFEANALPRHSGFLQGRHAFSSDDFQYSTTEFSLGYRYRIINKSTFSIYGQVKLATLNISNVTLLDTNNMQKDFNETAFDVPLIFGIGSDIKVGDNSYLTLIYGELFAVLLDNQGNFSADIAIGYKFNL